MPAAYGLLRCIGKSAVKHIVNLFTYGVGGDILVDTWEYWKKATREEKRAAEVQAVAQLAGAELRAEVARIVREEAAALPPAQQAQVAAYLGQVPAAIRRSLRRPSDPTGTTTAPGTVFRKPEDLLPLLPAALPRFKAGDRPLPGVDWELVELLGIGGFGEVWKARNPHFDGVAPVALKFCLDAAARERLLKHEAAVLNQVMRQGKHEGIVPLLHTYLSADPPCLAYEFIDGGDLAGLIQEKATGLAPKQAAEVMKRVAEIVAFAHRLNPPIVHRDLKPANILVNRTDGSLVFRVTDFGIGGLALQHAVAQSRRGTNSGEFLTAAVRGAYTPLYASPQQMRGEDPDPRDDVYALGVIWHQLLTGDLTKGRPGGEAWKKRLTDLGMTPALLALLASSYEDERADRPDNALALAESLGELLHNSSDQAEGLSSKINKKDRKRLRIGLVVVIGFVALLIGVIALILVFKGDGLQSQILGKWKNEYSGGMGHKMIQTYDFKPDGKYEYEIERALLNGNGVMEEIKNKKEGKYEIIMGNYVNMGELDIRKLAAAQTARFTQFFSVSISFRSSLGSADMG